MVVSVERSLKCFECDASKCDFEGSLLVLVRSKSLVADRANLSLTISSLPIHLIT
jgi:hypothetical protein